jgi:hypothetical protein
MHALRTILVAAMSFFLIAPSAHGADFFSVRSFKLHEFDRAILEALGLTDRASVTYLRELATVTGDEIKAREKYEDIRCHPFYVMKDGRIENDGYNCQTFFCVGYMKSPVICRDRDGKARGGVVEINKRLAAWPIDPTKKFFDDYPEADRTQDMQDAIRMLGETKCRPFYHMEYDVIAGQGYACEEIGEFPRYSAANTCIDDWRDEEGFVCEIAQREDEYQMRLKALGKARMDASILASQSTGVNVETTTTESGITVRTSVTTSTGASVQISLRTFPDVEEGKYGYTAIVSLATLGVVNGYADGTFKPANRINRAEFARLFMDGLHASDVQGEAECFPDVGTQWFSAAACAAKRLGWIQGYADGRFGPGRDITKGEGLKIVVASLGGRIGSKAALPLGVDEGDWYAPYVRKAVELGILLEPTFDGDAPASRADAAVWMYRAAKHRATLAARASAE